MRKNGMSGLLTVISSNTNCTKETCYCFREWVTHTEQTLVTKTRFSHREASLKMLLVSKWKYPRSVEADLGSVLTVSCYGASPLCMSKCFCQQQQLLTSTIFFMHFHKCTNSFTASGHKNLLLDEPWTQPPPRPPGDDGASKHEGITDKIRPITFSSSMDFFFFCLYTNTLSTDLHMKRVQDCDWSKKKSSSPIKYCLSWSRNGKNMKSIIVTVATMIANIHIMSNKLRSMYNVEQKQHAGETTEPFYKTICRSV